MNIYISDKIFIINIALIFTFLLIISGCKTVQTPSCVSEKQKGLIIKWGDYNNEKREFDGHLMKSNAEIFYIKAAGLKEKYDEELLGTVTSENYCKILNDIRKEFLTTQTLNSPGNISRIIEFNNPTTKVIIRAVWNPKFKTHGSKGFRKIYERLQEILRTTN